MTEPRLSPPPGSRVAVVGGCGGIGRALVDAATLAGLRVAVLDLPAALAAHPPAEGTAAVAVDVTDERSVAAAFAGVADAFGALDGLVNLAGIPNRPVAWDALAVAEWDAVLATNLRSAYLCARAAAPLLRRGRAPAIVNMASGLAARLMPGHSAYGVSKAGVVAFTKALAVELAPGIRANAVAPGAVRTDFLRGGTGRLDAPGDPVRVDPEPYIRTVPMGRMAEPEDVAGPILFLLGPASAFVTGQVLHINGGTLTP